jgi:DNA primase catalytic subunit
MRRILLVRSEVIINSDAVPCPCAECGCDIAKIMDSTQRRKQAEWSKKERRSLIGYLRCVHTSAVQRVDARKTTAKKITFSRQELVAFALNKSNYRKLHAAWVRSGYENKLAPSIDRIDNDGNYTLENIRFITKSENSRKGKGNRIVATVVKGQAMDFTTIYFITTTNNIRAGTPLIFDTAEQVIRTNHAF